MRVTAAFTLLGRGDALFTDQPFTTAVWSEGRTKKRLRFAGDGRMADLEIKSVEAARKADGEYLAFFVADIDEATRAYIVGREFEWV